MALKAGVHVVVDKSEAVIAAARSLAQKQVMVGIPEAASNRPGETITNATIGYLNEYGAPELNIPARPHLVPGVSASRDDYIPHLRKAGEATLEGKDPDVFLGRAGQVAVNRVRQLIQNRVPPPLAEATLAKRRAKGRTGDVPLIDRGEYIGAITWAIRKKT